MAIPETVSDLLAPIMPQFGVELVDVEWAGGILRVVVDADGGVTTDQLATVNRMVSPLLDQHDPIPGRYTLEVSSPGVERPLKRPDHYRRAIGENVIVKTHPGLEPRRIKGELLAVDHEGIEVEVVEVDGVDLPSRESRRVRFADIDKTRTVFDWGATPKARKPGSAKKH